LFILKYHGKFTSKSYRGGDLPTPSSAANLLSKLTYSKLYICITIFSRAQFVFNLHGNVTSCGWITSKLPRYIRNCTWLCWSENFETCPMSRNSAIYRSHHNLTSNRTALQFTPTSNSNAPKLYAGESLAQPLGYKLIPG